MPRSPQWMDLYQIWFRESSRGRNQLCGILLQSAHGFRCREVSKFAVSHWLGRSPLTQCWRYAQPVVLPPPRSNVVTPKLNTWNLPKTVHPYKAILFRHAMAFLTTRKGMPTVIAYIHPSHYRATRVHSADYAVESSVCPTVTRRYWE